MENTVFNSDEVYVLDEQRLVELKRIALAHPLKRSRVCLHQSRDSSVQEMVIVAHRDSLIEAHKHPANKPESYHIIEGRMLVKIFDNDGTMLREIVLNDNINPKMYRIEGGIWHQPIPLTEWVVYHEVFTGPFAKETDVIYCDWSQLRNSRELALRATESEAKIRSTR